MYKKRLSIAMLIANLSAYIGFPKHG